MADFKHCYDLLLPGWKIPGSTCSGLDLGLLPLQLKLGLFELLMHIQVFCLFFLKWKSHKSCKQIVSNLRVNYKPYCLFKLITYFLTKVPRISYVNAFVVT